MPSPSKTPTKAPICVIIAGPNGAGKTTFAREFLPREAGIVLFVSTYRTLADAWAVYDNSEEQFRLVEEGP